MVLIAKYRTYAVAAMVFAVLFGVASSGHAQATGTISGTVKDVQGGVIPGASITLISETRGTKITSVTSATGDFVMTNIPGDTYTVRTELSGFRVTERKGIRLTPGDRVSVGTITIEQGGVSETVLVSDEVPLIQTQTGDRSFTVSQESVENLPITGRNFASFAALTPGVNGVTRADGARTNYVLDGVSSVNTGGNQQGLQVNPEAIAEVKVIASAYQAEYGRTNGITIAGVTRSGGNEFRSTAFDVERHSSWNENTWANQKNGLPKQKSDQRDWGFTVGGPIGKAGGTNKLFFFFSEQFQPRTGGGATNQFRVPTLDERNGDFSKTVTNTGALFNTIRDGSLGLPCTAANTAGCFRDGGVLGKIPQDQLYGLGLNILRLYPEPNLEGVTGLNYQVQQPTVKSNTFLHVIRVDYQASSKLRISAKYAGQNATVQTNPGTMPGYNDTIFQFPAILVPSATVTYVFNNTTILEGTWGLTQGNQLGNVPNASTTNRNAVGLANFPTLYPDNGLVPVGSFQEKVLKQMNAPFYLGGYLQMRPQFTWGTRVGSGPPNSGYPSFLCDQNTKDFAISITNVFGRHTFKFGYVSQDSLKRQNVGTITAGVLPIEGTINFAENSNNPLDTGFGFANAATGVFGSFAQMKNFVEGRYVYHNKDFYAQDNWKVTSRLTLDYGMRFTHHGPQYDEKGQASNFFPEKWSLSQAPELFRPGCSTGTITPGCTVVAVNPLTGASLGAGSSVSVGTIVPNSGVIANGFVQQGQGIAKENYIEKGLVFGPRVGGAFDLTGQQKYVVRASLGYFYDRLQGDSIFAQSGNPPTGEQATLVNSSLRQVAAGATGLMAPPAANIHYYDAKIGSSLSWNSGIQMTLPWASSLDVSYVGTHNFNSVAFGAISTPGGYLPIDMNAPDVGTAFLPQYQDPTKANSTVPGARAFNTDLLRPFRGLGAINVTWPRFYTHYDSIQTSFNRRFSRGWQAGVNYTLAMRFEGNTLTQQHFEHKADGSIALASYQANNDAIINNVGLRKHTIKGSFIWDLPNVEREGALMRVIGHVANDWQLSGIFTGGSGAPYDATFNYATGGQNVNLTGSPSYAARIVLNGDPGSGCSSDQYRQFNVGAYSGPVYTPGGSRGDESGVNLLTGCPDRTLDLAIQRNIKLGGRRQVQLRLDVFNALNTVVYNARQTQIQWTSPDNQTTVINNQFNADGSVNTARATPATAGAGAVTGAQALRSMQVQLRFQF